MKPIRIIGYASFFVFSLILGLYLTFPWGALKDRLELELTARTGWRIESERLQPYWLTGVAIDGLKLQSPEAQEPFELDRVIAKAHILSFLVGARGVTAWIPVGEGELNLSLRQSSSANRILAQGEKVELGLIRGLPTLTGLPLTGEVDLDVDLRLDKEDAAKTAGQIDIKGSDLEIGEGGKVMGFPIPTALVLGNLDWGVEIADGKAEIPRQEMRGGDFDVDVEGTIDLASPIERSKLDVAVSFKPSPEFLKANGLIEALLNNIRRARGNDGFYTYAITGSMKHPRAFPRKR